MKNIIDSIINILDASADFGSINDFTHLNFTNCLEKKLEYLLDNIRILNNDSTASRFEDFLNLIDEIFRIVEDYNDAIVKIEGLLMEVHKIILENYIPNDYYEDDTVALKI